MHVYIRLDPFEGGFWVQRGLFEVEIESFLGLNEDFFSFRVNFGNNLFNSEVILSLVLRLNNGLKLKKLLVLKVEVVGLGQLVEDCGVMLFILVFFLIGLVLRLPTYDALGRSMRVIFVLLSHQPNDLHVVKLSFSVVVTVQVVEVVSDENSGQISVKLVIFR